MKARHTSTGFTIIEMIIGLAIFAVLVSALYGVLFGGLRLRETAQRAAEAGIPREHAAMRIRRDFAGIVAPSGVLAGAFTGTQESGRGGQADRLTFYTTSAAVDDDAPWGDIQRVEFYLEAAPTETDAEAQALMRKTTRDLLATTAEDTEEEIAEWRLLDGVRSLTFAYYLDPDWLETWDSTTEENKNPTAVSMLVEFSEDENGVAQPPLELVMQTAVQPRPTPTTGTTAGTGPTPTPTPGSSSTGVPGASNAGGTP